MLYLTISQGSRPDKARPILALSDQRLIGLLLDALRDLARTPEDTPPTTPERGTREGA